MTIQALGYTTVGGIVYNEVAKEGHDGKETSGWNPGIRKTENG